MSSEVVAFPSGARPKETAEFVTMRFVISSLSLCPRSRQRDCRFGFFQHFASSESIWASATGRRRAGASDGVRFARRRGGSPIRGVQLACCSGMGMVGEGAGDIAKTGRLLSACRGIPIWRTGSSSDWTWLIFLRTEAAFRFSGESSFVSVRRSHRG